MIGISFSSIGRGFGAPDASSFVLERQIAKDRGNSSPSRAGRYSVFLDGKLVHREALWRALAPDREPCPESDQEMLLCLLVSGISLKQIAARAEGAFFASIVDFEGGTVSFVNDRFGLRPHYYVRSGSAMVLAPSIRQCISGSNVTPELDWQSVVEYLCLQCVMEERTLIKGVLLYPAGSIAVFNLNGGTFAVTQYADWSEVASERFSGTFEDATDEAVFLFRAACAAAGGEAERTGLYLSGGLDSRLILAASGRGVDLHTFCFGPADSPDIVYGRWCSGIYNTNHHELIMRDGRWISEVADEHTRLTEGGHCLIHAHNFWMAEAVGELIETNLSGHFGDLLLGGSYIYGGDVQGLRESTWNVFLSKWGAGYPSPLAVTANMRMVPPGAVGMVADSFQKSLEPMEGIPPAMAHDIFALQFHGRKQVQYYMVHNRHLFDSGTPFLDIALLRFLYSIPLTFRADRRLQISMLDRMSPRLARVPWAGTGLPPINRGLTRLRSLVTGRANALASSLVGFKVFSPRGPLYNDCYATWFAGDLAGWTQELLTSASSRVRPAFVEGHVEGLVRDHIAGTNRTRHSTARIGLLLTLELLMRHFAIQL